ncbi:hypothetical protein REC12_06655 [Desulfosporosinus sp. PR]|nr:hypothetical protein [Desulfosporosinus sp. PR]MDQ7093265.1 hypothetical protein [Desulfosporosinus sp. PR]
MHLPHSLARTSIGKITGQAGFLGNASLAMEKTLPVFVMKKTVKV